jgi:hypothetical protein
LISYFLLFPLKLLNAVLVGIVERNLQVSLRGLFGLLHPALVVRIREVGAMVGLLVGAEPLSLAACRWWRAASP